MRETGIVFMIPTCLFIGCSGDDVAWAGEDCSVAADILRRWSRCRICRAATATVGLWLLLQGLRERLHGHDRCGGRSAMA